jgi:hypothetical protein
MLSITEIIFNYNIMAHSYSNQEESPSKHGSSYPQSRKEFITEEALRYIESNDLPSFISLIERNQWLHS